MKGFIEVKEILDNGTEGKKHLVNLEHVKYIKQSTFDDKSLVYFDYDKEYISVKENLNEIKKLIQDS